MRQPVPRPRRGQALVEAALAMLLFVTILIFGIHFAEVGFLSLKVTEAGNFAIWDATRYRPHNAALNQWGYAWQSSSSAMNEANYRYHNFNGLSSRVGAGGTVTQVFTRGSNLFVGCGPNNTVASLAPFRGNLATNGQTGIACSAAASISGFHIPQVFVEGRGGLFATRHWSPLTIRVCSVGYAAGGGCPGGIGLMIDDWGLDGWGESQPCSLAAQQGVNGCENPGYYWDVFRTYTRMDSSPIGASEGTALAETVGAFPSFSAYEGAFWMSFQGSDSPYGPFMENIPSGVHYGQAYWQTSPYKLGNQNTPYTYAFWGRQMCFLGLPC